MTRYLGAVSAAFIGLGLGFAQVQIVDSDAPVQSRKRGVGANALSDADFRALAPGVSWYYNWGTTPLAKPADVPIEFLPMVWGGAQSSQTALSNYLAAGNRPWRVLALNEPNLKGQAFLTPSNAAIVFRKVKEICDPYNIPVICPHMAIGTAPADSITAYDPIRGSNVTYTFQQDYLQAFLYYCGSTNPAGMGTHSYSPGNPNGLYGEIKWILELMHAAWPTQTVWLTEFCPWDATNYATVLAMLIPAVDYCERTPWVEGYAWFKERVSGNPYNSLLAGSGVLTPTGEAYVQMPVHDPNIFYRVPGRLQAERYVTLINADASVTTDADGLADMKATSANARLFYNLYADAAGNYPVRFRVAGATGQIQVRRGDTLLATASVTQTGWSTVAATVPLVAGTQTLSITLSANNMRLNWVDFLQTNGTPSVPKGLTAAASGTQAVLSWRVAAGATSYNVKRSTFAGGPYTLIAVVTNTSHTDAGLALGWTYFYVVSAVNAAGESGDSAEVSVTATFPPVNLALNKPVTVSSVQSSSYPGSNAVDGNTGTRWSSAFSDPQWIYVDLQGTYDITGVVLNWENAYAKAYQIQVSPDAVTWTTIYSTNNGAGGVERLDGLSGTGRYVRMYGTQRATTYGYSIWEFEVYGTVPKPTGLVAIANEQDVSLSWTPSPGATAYNVKKALVSGGPYSTIASVTAPSYTDTNVLIGTTYYYVVSALNEFSQSRDSEEAIVTPCISDSAFIVTNNGPIYAGMTLYLFASPVPGAAYVWAGPNGFISTNQNPVIANAPTEASGTYTVTARIGNCAVTNATTVTVYPPAKVSIQITDTGLTLYWPAGVLECATNLNGPWFELQGATPPYEIVPSAPQQFYRVRLE